MVANELFAKPKSFKGTLGELPKGEIELSHDSRTHKKGQGFFAFKGENFDAFNFVEEVLKRGTPLIIYHYSEKNEKLAGKYHQSYPTTVFLSVNDTLKYIQELSHLQLLDWKEDHKKIIGITGSNGKTTTKEMLYHFLNSAYPGAIHKTSGNFNNHLGVPYTLLGLEKKHDVIIVEMGTNHPGEIKALCEIACPNAGIITNIGPAHLEFFKSVENVFKEKRNLLDFVKGQGPFILNFDDPNLNTVDQFSGLTTFGEKNGQIKYTLEGNQINLGMPDGDVALLNKNLMGRHNFENLAGAFLLSYNLFPKEKETFISAASKFKPTNNRSIWIDKGEKKFFLDAYNANPGSMKASLLAFIKYTETCNIPQEHCLFILGDMNELGDQSDVFHKDMGIYLNDLKVENVAFLGKFSNDYGMGYKNPAKIFASKTHFEKEWPKLIQSYKYFFLKGSRSLQLESLVDIN